MAGGRVFEMLWDCRYCGTRKLLAKSQRYCPQCGAPQDSDTRYFPADDEKVEVSGYRYEGADKVCKACQTPHGALARFCARCGAPLADAVEARRVADPVKSTAEKFAASLSLHRQMEATRRDRTHPRPKKPQNPVRRAWIRVLFIAVVVLLATSLLWTRPQTVSVAGHYWRQEIRIDRFGPVSESAWCGLLPPGAYEVISRSEVRAHPRIIDGQDCRIRPIDHDDGVYVERTECQPRDFSEPIHDLRCDYRIDRWTPSRTVVAEGYDLSPRWPETGLISARACRGCEREGARSGLYELILTDGEHIERCPLPLDRWRAAKAGSRWRLAVGALDGRPRCDTMEPAGMD